MNPTPDQAYQFALMLLSGMPSLDAMVYFVPPDTDVRDLKALHDRWMKSEEVQAATLKLQGKSWQDMGLMDRIQYAMDKHYSEMAYFLYTHNYSTLTGAEKAKADTARTTLESRIAGTSGKLDALSQFWEDLSKGRAKIVRPADDKPKPIVVTVPKVDTARFGES